MANTEKLECGFCYQSEQGKHGEVRREWSKEFEQYIAVCRKHRLDRCAFPGECLMAGDHMNSECHTVAMYEQFESEIASY